MPTYLYRPICFLGLLVVCLLFAPARLVTGDRSAYSYSTPTPAAAVSTTSSEKSFDELCQDDPIAAIARSMHRYKSSVEGYTCTLVKQERMNGKMKPREVIRCDFRESPFAVRLEWLEGRGRAAIMLYPAGDRADRLAAVPSNELARKVIPYVTKGIHDADVRAQARYPVTEFGLYQGSFRVHTAMVAAKERGTLQTRYDGLHPVPELGGLVCHVLHRDFVVPEEEGQTGLTLYFDPKTLMQVGAVLTAGEELIGTYYFKDVVLNPPFAADHFAMERLK